MMEDAQPSRAVRPEIFPQLVKPCPEEIHLGEDLKCEAGSDWVPRALGVGGGYCRVR
jgi:hypothetical protein